MNWKEIIRLGQTLSNATFTTLPAGPHSFPQCDLVFAWTSWRQTLFCCWQTAGLLCLLCLCTRLLSHEPVIQHLLIKGHVLLGLHHRYLTWKLNNMSSTVELFSEESQQAMMITGSASNTGRIRVSDWSGTGPVRAGLEGSPNLSPLCYKGKKCAQIASQSLECTLE